MDQTEPTFKMAMDKPELEYLVNKKEEDIAAQFKAFKFLIAFIIVISIVVAIGLYIITRVAPELFINADEPLPNIPLTCLKLMLGLLCVVMISAYYSYSKTLKKLIKDIKMGEKIIEPCIIIRKFHAKENNTCHVYITSNIRFSIEVTMDEYRKLNEDVKIYIEYSVYSKIFFGYSIERPRKNPSL